MGSIPWVSNFLWPEKPLQVFAILHMMNGHATPVGTRAVVVASGSSSRLPLIRMSCAEIRLPELVELMQTLLQLYIFLLSFLRDWDLQIEKTWLCLQLKREQNQCTFRSCQTGQGNACDQIGCIINIICQQSCWYSLKIQKLALFHMSSMRWLSSRFLLTTGQEWSRVGSCPVASTAVDFTSWALGILLRSATGVILATSDQQMNKEKNQSRPPYRMRGSDDSRDQPTSQLIHHPDPLLSPIWWMAMPQGMGKGDSTKTNWLLTENTHQGYKVALFLSKMKHIFPIAR